MANNIRETLRTVGNWCKEAIEALIRWILMLVLVVAVSATAITAGYLLINTTCLDTGPVAGTHCSVKIPQVIIQ